MLVCIRPLPSGYIRVAEVLRVGISTWDENRPTGRHGLKKCGSFILYALFTNVQIYGRLASPI